MLGDDACIDRCDGSDQQTYRILQVSCSVFPSRTEYFRQRYRAWRPQSLREFMWRVVLMQMQLINIAPRYSVLP